MAQVLVETSARHIHLSQADLETLFGAGYELTPKKDLSQPGQFACEERVTVVGPKKELAGVSILGPVRPETQVELSLTDARSIGLSAPVRESGDVAGSAGCKLVGPKGEVEIAEGVIIIKSISREAGSRTKMAVYSRDEEVDAVGSCIGNKGAVLSPNNTTDYFFAACYIVMLVITHHRCIYFKLIKKFKGYSGILGGYKIHRA